MRSEGTYYEFDEWEFYDLKSDPDELMNLYEDPAYAPVIGRLKSGLEDLREQYGDDSDVSIKPARWRAQYR